MKNILYKRVIPGIVVAFVCLLLGLAIRYVKAETSLNKESISDIITERAGVTRVEAKSDFQSIHLISGPVGISEKGLAVIADNGGSVKFSYKNSISLNNFDENLPFVEILPLIGEDFTSLESITITLTDEDDSDNSVSIYVYSANSNHAVYARVEYAGKSLGASSEGVDKIWESKYGAYIRGVYFENQFYSGGNWIDVNTLPCAVYYSAEEKSISLGSNDSAGKTLVLDLDNSTHVGKGFEWTGFNGNVNLSFSLSFKETKSGGIIVKSINGVNLDCDVSDDNSPLVIPKIVPIIDSSYSDGLPDGAVGINYSVPDILASDVYYGQNQELSYEIQRSSGSSYETYESEKSLKSSDNFFIPDKIGEYKIVYYAKNPGGTGRCELSFKIIGTRKPILIALAEEVSSPELFQIFKIPEVTVYGGSGNIEKTEKLLYNGRPVDLTSDRSIRISESGKIVLVVSCSDYLGEVENRSFEFSTSGEVTIFVSDMPLIIRKGEKTVLPEGVAYSADGERVDVKIFADGTELGDDRVLETESDSGNITVEYKTESGKSKTFSIKVLGEENVTPKDMFINQEGDSSFEDSTRGVKVSATKDSTFIYGYSAVTGAASSKLFINLSAVTELSDGKENVIENEYQYIDILLNDVNSLYKDTFVRVYRECDEGDDKSYLQIDGAGTKYLVKGSLNGVLPLRLYISENSLYNDYTKACICELGEYAAGISNVSFKIGGVSGKASVFVNKLGNVNLNYGGDEWRDVNTPIISFASSFPKESTSYIGKEFTIPSAFAQDMQSHDAKLKVTINTPSGETLITSEDLSNGLSFTLSQTGVYKIIFGLKDVNNGWKNEVYTVTVREKTSPDLVVEKLIKSEISVNTKIIFPKATASRNGESFEVFSYIKRYSDGKIFYIKEGEEFVFETAGTYSITWFTHDTDYNYTTYTQVIEVK